MRTPIHRWLSILFFLLTPAATVFAEIVGGGTCTAWPGGRWQPDTPAYGTQLVTGVPVVMDDGVTLFADIGYPTDLATGQRAAGTFPVLLSQNPYVTTPPPDSYFISRGYIYINVDVRGTLRTEAPNNAPLVNGLFDERQARDGAALVHWAANLAGSNGVVGLTGCSQLGINQIFTAAAVGRHSPLKAIAPACSANGYEVYFAGGIPSSTIGLFGSPSPLSGTKHVAENAAAGAALRSEILAGGDAAYNRAHWQERSTARVAGDVVRNGIPALLWTGWNATESNESIKLFSIMQNAWLGRPELPPMLPFQPNTPRYQIIVGPGAHGQGLDKSIMLEWYDTWLKGQRTRIDQAQSSLHLFELKTSRWVNARTYPIVRNYTPYYLAATGQLSPKRPTDNVGSDTVMWAQPSVSGATLTYATPPFATGATLAGPIAASLYASSSNTNMELIATLNDVAPDGSVAQISTGALLGSLRALTDTAFGRQPQSDVEKLIAQLFGLSPSWYDQDGDLILPRHPFTADHYLVPQNLVRMDVEIPATVWSVLPGHSLQLVLSTQSPSSMCASLLSALAEPTPCLLTAPQQATLPGGMYQISRSRTHPSTIQLPLVPFRSLKEAVSATTPTSATQTQPLDWDTPGYCGAN